MKPLINEDVLKGIPEHLIRPLLAFSIRAAQINTLDDCALLLKEARRLGHACREASGNSLYFITIENMINQKMYALQDVEKSVKKSDESARAVNIEVDQWRVNVYQSGQNKDFTVCYIPWRATVSGIQLRPQVKEDDTFEAYFRKLKNQTE